MSAPFRLVSFNTENLDWSPAGELRFKRRLSVLRPLLAAVAADILCLQEVDAQRPTPHAPRRFIALDRLVAGTAYEGFARATSRRPGTDAPADVHNLAILSRWPIVATRQLHHDIVAPWRWTPPAGRGVAAPIEIVFDRPALYARIAPPHGPELHVLNLHLRAPRAVPLPGTSGARSGPVFAEGQFLAAQKREGQALETRLFVDALFDDDKDASIAVCGDFNSESHDAPARILRGAAEEDAEAPFALTALAERLAESARYSVIHAGRRTLLDHILVSRALAARCARVEIMNEGLADEATAPDPILGSLHAPIMASFRRAGCVEKRA
ncbi:MULTISPECIES: endonuclease/exonuclease/phosphatase family protein [Methylosinus]|uniref:Endonuclease/exonuclease/phosphatase family protein n=1 Tax=Methylosinus trichosporium (strain ATCC 35070 / NCIMB 11131 / UNIQEM 75 / OB3b) TaxID=595536 RepID=A0A2D2D1D5_METT3|nr:MULTISPECIES: endonuclease/exonuclease/phosphatase family protein [Methylosinus]ATQ68679.1 endonuclease/exonuclease/phosphatase family protein [Methylosinus trichosporium OB3b]OBS53158.1 endonuclease [Methylosinus sp. 3S-1]